MFFDLIKLRVVKSISVSRDWLISIYIRVKCEMLDFGAAKWDLLYAHEASVSKTKVKQQKRIENRRSIGNFFNVMKIKNGKEGNEELED